jgi:hypothetical protein
MTATPGRMRWTELNLFEYLGHRIRYYHDARDAVCECGWTGTVDHHAPLLGRATIRHQVAVLDGWFDRCRLSVPERAMAQLLLDAESILGDLTEFLAVVRMSGAAAVTE